MNRKTSRLLTAYARSQDQKPSEAKRSWNKLPAKDRAKMRLEIDGELFSTKLAAWRGGRLQKQAADILEVPLKTYVNWEQNQNTPGTLARHELLRRMSQNPEKTK